MFKRLKNLKIYLLIGLVVIASFVFYQSVKAADSLFYFSWESNGSVPAEYQGKSLVVVGSMVKVSLQPLVYDSGYKDPSQWNVRWFVNGELYQEGEGLFNFRFIPKIYSSGYDYYQIGAEVVFPNGLTKREEIEIPILEPKVVVRVIDGELERRDNFVDIKAEEARLKADGYFFNKNHLPLITRWYVDGSYEYSPKSGEILIERFDFLKERNIRAILESSTDSLVRGMGELNLNFY